MNQQRGFTLIELMIVVAIIGILAAIAIPTYQSFIAKTQTAESIILLDAARMNTEDHISITGQFPLDKQALIDLQTKTDGTYGDITGTANKANNLSSGDIVYKFKSSDINDQIKNKSIWYHRTLTGEWNCQTDLNNRLTPDMCQSGYAAPTGT